MDGSTTDLIRKEKAPFCHSVRVASALKGPVTMVLDVMQSSESIGLPPGIITNPEYSIQIGIKYFAEVMEQGKGDINLALQSYNFGNGFIEYALERGGYSVSLISSSSTIIS